MVFLVAYDIANDKRLRRIARLMEEHGIRVQKSVFLFEGSDADLEELFTSAAERMDLEDDLIQAWRIASGQPKEGRSLGKPIPIFPDSIVFNGDEASILPTHSDDEADSMTEQAELSPWKRWVMPLLE